MLRLRMRLPIPLPTLSDLRSDVDEETELMRSSVCSSLGFILRLDRSLRPCRTGNSA